MMRNRSGLIIFLFVLLIIIIMAQNGSLSRMFGGTGNGTPGFFVQPAETNRPLIFSTTAPNSGLILPTAYYPTAYIAPVYSPTYTPGYSGNVNNNNNVNAAPPVGIVSASGQCIVPNGWQPYTIQAGETLALIAQLYNLTSDQLAAANCMSNPDLIYEGQVIAVP
jgi:hypothetical protein